MKKINDYQKELYEMFDLQGSREQLQKYEQWLGRFKGRKNIRILDIGGAGGCFALLLKQYFGANGVEIYVIDSVEYDSWKREDMRDEICFICDSVENLERHFREDTFDIIFANRVFHHFVDASWRKSLNGMEMIMRSVRKILKEDGAFFILDHFFNGAAIDWAPSFLIYTLTSIRSPLLVKFVHKLGSESAGVGVCFQSEEMWKKRVVRCGFSIEHVHRDPLFKLSLIKKICLLCKNARYDCVIYAVPRKA